MYRIWHYATNPEWYKNSNRPITVVVAQVVSGPQVDRDINGRFGARFPSTARSFCYYICYVSNPQWGLAIPISFTYIYMLLWIAGYYIVDHLLIVYGITQRTLYNNNNNMQILIKRIKDPMDTPMRCCLLLRYQEYCHNHIASPRMCYWPSTHPIST